MAKTRKVERPNRNVNIGPRKMNPSAGFAGITQTARPFDYAALAKQFAAMVMPRQKPRPSFEKSGLYNESDVNAQAQAEFNPYFQEQGSNLERDVQRGIAQRMRQREDIGRQHIYQQGTQQADYLNRGLSRSGAAIGAEQFLGAQQGREMEQQNLYDTLGQEGAVESRKLLGQRKAGALEDYRTKAYNRAFQNYLNRYAT